MPKTVIEDTGCLSLASCLIDAVSQREVATFVSIKVRLSTEGFLKRHGHYALCFLCVTHHMSKEWKYFVAARAHVTVEIVHISDTGSIVLCLW